MQDTECDRTPGEAADWINRPTPDVIVGIDARNDCQVTGTSSRLGRLGPAPQRCQSATARLLDAGIARKIRTKCEWEVFDAKSPWISVFPEWSGRCGRNAWACSAVGRAARESAGPTARFVAL